MRYKFIELLCLFQNLNAGWIKFRNKDAYSSVFDISSCELRPDATSKTNGKWYVKIHFPANNIEKFLEFLTSQVNNNDAPPMEVNIPTHKFLDANNHSGKIILHFDREYEESEEGYTKVMDYLNHIHHKYRLQTDRELKIYTSMDDFDQTAYVHRRISVLTNPMQLLWDQASDWKKNNTKFIKFYNALKQFYNVVNFDGRLHGLKEAEYNHSPLKHMIDLIVQIIEKQASHDSVEEKIEFFKECENDAKIKSLEVTDPFIELFKLILVSAATYAVSYYLLPGQNSVAISITIATSLTAGHFISKPNKLGEAAIQVVNSAKDMLKPRRLTFSPVQQV